MKLLNLILITLISLAIYTPANAQGSRELNPPKTTFKQKIITDKLQVTSLRGASFLFTNGYGNVLGLSDEDFFDRYLNNIDFLKYFAKKLKKNSEGYNNPVEGLYLSFSEGDKYFCLLNKNKEKIQKGEKGSEEYEYPLYVQINGDWYGIEGVKIENESH